MEEKVLRRRTTQYALSLLIGAVTVIAVLFPLGFLQTSDAEGYWTGLGCLAMFSFFAGYLTEGVTAGVAITSVACILIGVTLTFTAWSRLKNHKEEIGWVYPLCFLCLVLNAVLMIISYLIVGNVNRNGAAVEYLNLYPGITVAVLFLLISELELYAYFANK